MVKYYRIIQLGEGEVTLEMPRKITGQIDSTVFSSVIEKKEHIDQSDFTITCEGDNYILSTLNSTELILDKITELIFELEWRVVDKLVKQNNSFLQIHSATLKYDKQGYIFIGEGGSGKTSMSIFLAQNRFTFLSDEIGMLDPENDEIQPFPRNLIIKPFVSNLLDFSKDIKIPIDGKNGKIGAYFVNPDRFGQVELSASTQVEKIYFISAREDNKGYSKNRLGDFEAVNRLLKYCFNKGLYSEKLIDIVSNIVDKCETYELKLSNPLTLDKRRQSSLLKEIIE